MVGGANPHGTIPRVFSARSQRCIVRTASNLAKQRQQVSMPKMEPRLYTSCYWSLWVWLMMRHWCTKRNGHIWHTELGHVASIREHVTSHTSQKAFEHGDWGHNRTSAGKSSRPFRRKFATLPWGVDWWSGKVKQICSSISSSYRPQTQSCTVLFLSCCEMNTCDAR